MPTGLVTIKRLLKCFLKTLARETILAYPKYGEVFEIYTDASSRQLGAVITQDGKPIAFLVEN